MKYIFLIAAEHQLFQVKEAHNHFNISRNESIIIILKYGPTNFIENLLNNHEFPNIFVFDSWKFSDLVFNRNIPNKFIRFCEKIKVDLKNCIFFSCHYGSDHDLLFLSIVKPSRYYLMDEGTSNFATQLKRSEGRKNLIKNTIKSLLYFSQVRLPSSLIYFTQYNLIPSKFDHVEKYDVRIKQNELLSLIEDEVIFLGSAIADGKHGKIVNLDDYLSFLEKVSFDIGTKKKYYYPHRFESDYSLQLIQQLGFIIKKNDIPFEILFSKQNKFPSILCSFFTTCVLDNISKNYSRIPELRVYKFNCSLIEKDREIYENIYKEMKLNKRINFFEI